MPCVFWDGLSREQVAKRTKRVSAVRDSARIISQVSTDESQAKKWTWIYAHTL